MEKTSFDLLEDWWLIEASFQQVYGIDIQKEIIEDDTMSYRKFTNLLAGLPSSSSLIETLRYRIENGIEKTEKYDSVNDAIKILG